jgi:hypothetical protein
MAEADIAPERADMPRGRSRILGRRTLAKSHRHLMWLEESAEESLPFHPRAGFQCLL